MLSVRRSLGLAALASLATLASPTDKVLADPSVSQAIVVNPATMPALTSSVDDPGRVPYQAFVAVGCGAAACEAKFLAVSPGHRLVIQHLSGFAEAFSTLSGAKVRLNYFDPMGNGFEPSIFFAPVNGTSTAFDQPVLAYADAGGRVSVDLFVQNSTLRAVGISLTGYLLDCNASPCAPIAP